MSRLTVKQIEALNTLASLAHGYNKPESGFECNLMHSKTRAALLNHGYAETDPAGTSASGLIRISDKGLEALEGSGKGNSAAAWLRQARTNKPAARVAPAAEVVDGVRLEGACHSCGLTFTGRGLVGELCPICAVGSEAPKTASEAPCAAETPAAMAECSEAPKTGSQALKPASGRYGARWSYQQEQIFDFFAKGKGSLVVRARAGTGKTTTLIEGLKYAPELCILVAAFNKVIASELNQRLTNKRAEAKTGHALGFAALRAHLGRVTIDDRGLLRREITDDQIAQGVPASVAALVYKLSAKIREVVPPSDSLCTAHNAEILAVRYDCLPDEASARKGYNRKFVVKAALEVLARLAKPGRTLIDFADMVWLPLVHGLCTPRYDLIVLDEAQDTNAPALELCLGHLRQGGRVIVLGDDRQAIYGFRGAASDALDRLKKRLNASELGLTVTYRCAPEIVALAAEIVPDYCAARTDEGKIETLSYDKALEALSEGDALLSTRNAPLMSACIRLNKSGKRARVRGKDIGRSILARLRDLGVTNLNDLAGACQRWLEQEHTRLQGLPAEIVDEKLELVRDQTDLLIALSEGLSTVAELTARVESLFTDETGGAVVLCSTVHKAKGLEWPTVALLQSTFNRVGGENDNVKYVAVTRAKDRLIWAQGE